MKLLTANMQLVITIVILLIIVFILLSIFIRFYVISKPYTTPSYMNNKEILNKDGVVILNNFISNDDITIIKKLIADNEIIKVKKYIIESYSCKQKIKAILGDDYEFHDYIFFIKKSQFHSCHRDYNGDFFNKDQEFPSYTMIIYLEDMSKCLDVIHKSHKHKGEYDFNITDYTQALPCNPGDAILFNANLVHSGSLNEKENNMRIQLKISNKNDLDVLKFYSNYNKVLNIENNTAPIIKHIQKHVSCQLPVVSSYLKDYDNNYNKDITNIGSSIFSSLFATLDTVTP